MRRHPLTLSPLTLSPLTLSLLTLSLMTGCDPSPRARLAASATPPAADEADEAADAVTPPPRTPQAAQPPQAAPVAWRRDAAAALREAREAGKPALIDFWAAWCEPCLRLDRETFSNPQVASALGRFVPIRVDATHPSAEADALSAVYKVGGYPTLLLIDSQGVLSSRHRFARFVSPADLLQAMSEVR